jgi:glycosyltransferase involved in cell wall biosynthesis
MRIIQITPGTGNFQCSACQRDHALVRALQELGHEVTLVPLYLPFVTDEPGTAAAQPIFYGGINVYLQQKSAFFRRTPRWLDGLFDAKPLLKLSARAANMTRPHDVGVIALSMLRGEEGEQVKELERLLEWLKSQPQPDVVCLSNALLAGMARRIKAELGVPVVCALQGEDYFLDDLVPPFNTQAWQVLRERSTDVDLFIAVSRYFGDRMSERLQLAPGRVVVVPNGVRPDGFTPATTPPQPPVLGFLAFMSQIRGLEPLVAAFIELKKRNRVPGLKLRAAGVVAASSQDYIGTLQRRLAEAGVAGDVEFLPELSRTQKQEFLRGVSVFSVPATYGEAFGIYLLEAMAAGLPLVQPRYGPFPELIESTGAGLLCEPDNPTALADAIEQLLLDPARARALGLAGRRAVIETFGDERMARGIAGHLQNVIARAPASR